MKAAKKYSDYDISEIAQQIQRKAEWLPQTFPEEFGDFKFDVKRIGIDGERETLSNENSISRIARTE